MSELLYTEKDYWKRHYERRFLELSYRVMKKARILSVVIDDAALAGTKGHELVRVTESAHKQTMLIELIDEAKVSGFYDEVGTFTEESWDRLDPGVKGV